MSKEYKKDMLTVAVLAIFGVAAAFCTEFFEDGSWWIFVPAIIALLSCFTAFVFAIHATIEESYR